MKKKAVILFVGAMLSEATAAMAVTIDFTSAEGYSAGQLAAHADWGGQNYFVVDPSGSGTVTLDGSLGWQKVFHKSGFAATNDTYTVGIEFSFSRNTNALSANRNVLSLSFLEVAGVNGERLDMQLQRLSSNNEKYKLAFYEDSGSSNSAVSSALFDEDELGFDNASDTDSDRLWLDLTLIRGADASSWTARGVICNLTDGTLWKELDVGTFDTSDAFFTDPLYPSINTTHLESLSCTSNRVVDVFHAAAGVASASEYPVAILSESDIEERVEGLANTLAGDLLSQGYSVRQIHFDDLCDAAVFNTNTFSCLVVPDALNYPAASSNNLETFLSGGGDLVLMGPGVFQSACWDVDGSWTPVDEILAGDSAVEINPETANYEADCDASSTAGVALTNGYSGTGMHLRLDFGSSKAMLKVNLSSTPSGANLISFALHSKTVREEQMVVSVTDSGGDTWNTVVEAPDEWSEVYLFPEDFDPEDGSGSLSSFAGIEDVSFGIKSSEISDPLDLYDFYLSDLRVVSATLPTGFDLSVGFSFPEVMEDRELYRYDDGSQIVSWEDQTILSDDVDLSGSFSGLSALAFEIPGYTHFIPLLSVADSYGRRRGWAVGVGINYDGPYENSQWLLMGVAESNFYSLASTRQVFSDALSAFRDEESLMSAADTADQAERDTVIGSFSGSQDAVMIHDGHFCYSNSNRFFAVGVNTTFQLTIKEFNGWNPARFEQLFCRMQRAGINTIRMYGGAFFQSKFSDRIAALKTLAAKYGVYIVPLVADHTDDYPSEATLRARANDLASFLEDDPSVLGIDLSNEPYYWDLHALTDTNGVSLYDSLDCSSALANSAWLRFLEDQGIPNFDDNVYVGSTFPYLEGTLQEPEATDLQTAYSTIDSILSNWISWQVPEIKAVDSDLNMTVGYNTVLDCFPANQELDFVAHHAYQRPPVGEGTLINATTMDRLHNIYPNRPIMLGEFGCTTDADVIDGWRLDRYNAAVSEFFIYLYSLANGYDGGCKWLLNDVPLVLSRRYRGWLTNDEDRIHQGRFGIFYQDGTFEGGMKPIGWATRVLSDAVSAGLYCGDLNWELCPDDFTAGLRFVFEGANCLFVADTSYSGNGLSFESVDDRPAVVMLRYEKGKLHVCATHDCTVSIDTAQFLPGAAGSGAMPSEVICADGELYDRQESGEELSFELLEGLPVVLRTDASYREQSSMIDFTSAEGYSSDQLAAHDDWGGNSNFLVDPSGSGTVTLDSAASWKKVFYTPGLSFSNDICTVGVEFSFSRSTNALSAASRVLSVDFFDAASVSAGSLTMQFQRLNWDNEKYRLSFWESSGSANTGANSAVFDEDDMGFDDALDSDSDSLWLGMTLIRGEDASSWTACGVVSNLTEGTLLAVLDVGTFDTSDSFFTGDLYPAFNSGVLESDSFTSSRVIDAFLATGEYYAAQPSIDPSMTVDFTAAEGYVPGTIYGQQQLWVGHDEPEFQVDDATEYLEVPSATGWKQAIYNMPMQPSASMLEVGGVFRFKRSLTPPASDLSMLTFEWKSDAAVGSSYVRAVLLRNPTAYRIGFSEDSGDFSFYNHVFLNESLLGFDSNIENDESDDLMLALRLYPGTTTNDWAASVVLSNLTENTLVSSFEMSEGSFVLDEDFLGVPLYGAIDSTRTNGMINVSDRLVDRFYISGTYESAFAAWTADYSLSGSNSEPEADPDGDALSNIEEYGLGGNPTNGSDTGYKPTVSTSLSGGTNYLDLAYVVLADPDSGVDYIVETRPDLVSGSWTNAGVVTVTGTQDSTFNTVTSSIPMEGRSTGFVRLRIIEQ